MATFVDYKFDSVSGILKEITKDLAFLLVKLHLRFSRRFSARNYYLFLNIFYLLMVVALIVRYEYRF